MQKAVNMISQIKEKKKFLMLYMFGFFLILWMLFKIVKKQIVINNINPKGKFVWLYMQGVSISWHYICLNFV